MRTIYMNTAHNDEYQIIDYREGLLILSNLYCDYSTIMSNAKAG